MPQFSVDEWFEVPGRGWSALVALDCDTSDFSHIIRKPVLLDGKEHVVLAVERFAHMPPWYQGERVGLLVAERH